VIALRFSGHFECRLPTDPDPTDEPRGVSGSVWAVAGEPDLDRVIRFQKPRVQRKYAPPVGVYVREVVVNGTVTPDHPLTGAPVDLVGNPRFEGRNGIVAVSGTEPIVPFTIRVAARGIVLERDSGVSQLPYTDLQGVQISQSGSTVASATGDWDFASSLRRRRHQLEADRDAARDDLSRAAFGARAECLRQNGHFLTILHGVRLVYAFALSGKSNVSHASRRFTSPPTTAKPWLIEFWLGGWDGDAMTGFVDGWLTIPEYEVEQLGAVQRLEFTERLVGPPRRRSAARRGA
jgi:hypothetical protein